VRRRYGADPPALTLRLDEVDDASGLRGMQPVFDLFDDQGGLTLNVDRIIQRGVTSSPGVSGGPATAIGMDLE